MWGATHGISVTRIDIRAGRLSRWSLALLLGAALGGLLNGLPAATAAASFQRTDIFLAAQPESIAVGDLDGQHGKDIVVALWSPGSVGVMLNYGDGTFAPMKTYTAGPACVGLAVDITLGDVTQPAPGNRLQPDGKLDAYVACAPYVVRLTGDGTGALGNPEAINLGVQNYLGSATLDLLTLMRRPDGIPIPLLVLQHAVGSFGRQLCISYELEPGQLVCNLTPVQGPLAVGDFNGSAPGVPPDEIVTSEGSNQMGFFGFAPTFPLDWGDSKRTVPGDSNGPESAAVGDLDNDHDLDVLVGQTINSLSARLDSIHYFIWGATGLDQVATPLPSTPGVDAVGIADVDGDGVNDVVAAGTYGTGMVHLGDGAGGFDGGTDLPQLGYLNPATATRVTMAVDDLTGDGQAEIVIADQRQSAVMVYCDASAPSGIACPVPPTAVHDDAVLLEDASATAIDVRANDTDPDLGPKVVTAVTQPAHGVSAVVGGGVTYRPDADYCNDLGGVPDTFTYTLNGGSSATVAVTVQCVLEPPTPTPTSTLPVPTPSPTLTLPPPPPPPPPPTPTAPQTCAAPGTVPHIIGTPGDDVIVGTVSRDVLSGRAGDDCLFGLGGADRMTGGTGADSFNGGGGDDRIKGDAGNDKINAGNGNDDITPGAGQDKANGQGGNDTIWARDGNRDTIDCGAGRDKVTADRTDAIKNCEFVKRAVRHG